jgi:cytidine deaminase
MPQILTHTCQFEIWDWEDLSLGDQILLQIAEDARGHARAGVSGFTVGAALLTSQGKTFVGCNIEDFAHNGCIHAEMGALATMVSSSTDRVTISMIAIVLGNADDEISIPPRRNQDSVESTLDLPYTPCGHCRTVLSQHQMEGEPIRVLALQPNGQILITSMNDLYPLGFGFTPSR